MNSPEVFGRCHLICGAALRCREFDVVHMMPKEGAVTGVPATGNPTVPRRELGAILKELRKDKRLTAEEVADRILISPSKLSRLETGDRGASARDINDLCDLYEVDDERRQHLLELAREGKQRAWWQLGLPYSAYVGLEAEASSIWDYGLGVIPGLLQTPDYARAVVRAPVPKLAPEVIEQRVQGRMARQRLLTSGDGPRFEAVMDESVLHRVVGSQAIMRAQLQRLLELFNLPKVTLRVVPYDAGVPLAPNNKFIILKSGRFTVPDVVFVEGLTGDLYLEDPSDVKTYELTFRTLIQQAAVPAATYELISAIIAT